MRSHPQALPPRVFERTGASDAARAATHGVPLSGCRPRRRERPHPAPAPGLVRLTTWCPSEPAPRRRRPDPRDRSRRSRQSRATSLHGRRHLPSGASTRRPARRGSWSGRLPNRCAAPVAAVAPRLQPAPILPSGVRRSSAGCRCIVRYISESWGAGSAWLVMVQNHRRSSRADHRGLARLVGGRNALRTPFATAARAGVE